MNLHLGEIQKQVLCQFAILPIYFMSVFTIPGKMRCGLEKHHSGFLCGGGSLESKIHLVSGLLYVQRFGH